MFNRYILTIGGFCVHTIRFSFLVITEYQTHICIHIDHFLHFRISGRCLYCDRLTQCFCPSIIRSDGYPKIDNGKLNQHPDGLGAYLHCLHYKKRKAVFWIMLHTIDPIRRYMCFDDRLLWSISLGDVAADFVSRVDQLDIIVIFLVSLYFGFLR